MQYQIQMNNNGKWVNITFTDDRERSIGIMVKMANDFAKTLPNDPYVDQNGIDAVAVYIGQYAICQYRVIPVEGIPDPWAD